MCPSQKKLESHQKEIGSRRKWPKWLWLWFTLPLLLLCLMAMVHIAMTIAMAMTHIAITIAMAMVHFTIAMAIAHIVSPFSIWHLTQQEMISRDVQIAMGKIIYATAGNSGNLLEVWNVWKGVERKVRVERPHLLHFLNSSPNHQPGCSLHLHLHWIALRCMSVQNCITTTFTPDDECLTGEHCVQYKCTGVKAYWQAVLWCRHLIDRQIQIQKNIHTYKYAGTGRLCIVWWRLPTGRVSQFQAWDAASALHY